VSAFKFITFTRSSEAEKSSAEEQLFKEYLDPLEWANSINFGLASFGKVNK